MSIVTIIAVVISSIAVLVTLWKIYQQQNNVITLLKNIEKKLSASISHEDLTSSQIQRKVYNLEQQLKTKKGDIDWKG